MPGQCQYYAQLKQFRSFELFSTKYFAFCVKFCLDYLPIVLYSLYSIQFDVLYSGNTLYSTFTFVQNIIILWIVYPEGFLFCAQFCPKYLVFSICFAQRLLYSTWSFIQNMLDSVKSFVQNTLYSVYECIQNTFILVSQKMTQDDKGGGGGLEHPKKMT